jgi:hypothetical protein
LTALAVACLHDSNASVRLDGLENRNFGSMAERNSQVLGRLSARPQQPVKQCSEGSDRKWVRMRKSRRGGDKRKKSLGSSLLRRKMSSYEDESSDDDTTASGATTFGAASNQTFSFATQMQEDESKASTLKLTLLLSKQYQHQMQLQAVLRDCVNYPQCATNIIGEYLYTHSVLDSY